MTKKTTKKQQDKKEKKKTPEEKSNMEQSSDLNKPKAEFETKESIQVKSKDTKTDESLKSELKIPDRKCTDEKCPFHGNLKIHGRVFVGEVISDKMHRTVSVQWKRKKIFRKYDRSAVFTSTIKAHNPDCIDAKEGDIVKIAETRPLSKTKNFVVLEVLEK